MSDENKSNTVRAQDYMGEVGTVIGSGWFETPLPARTRLVVVQYEDGSIVIWRHEDLEQV